MKIDYLKIINTFVKNTKTSGVLTEAADVSFKLASESKNTVKTNVSSNQNISLNQNQYVKFNSIDRMAQAKLIKALLNFPENIEELFSFLVYKKIFPESLEALLKQNQKINIDLIKQMLETNSKESMSKLIKLFQQAPGGTQNTEQLKEILALLSGIIPKKDSTPQNILTNLTLLYLPLLPLAEKQNLEIKLEKHKEQEEDESEQIALVIYITTINLGRFKISISLNKNYSIKIQIENFKENQNEINKEYLEQILTNIKKQTRKDKIDTKAELFIVEQKESFENKSKANEEKFVSQEKEREVIISPVKDISPIIVIIAQKIAKIIIEADEKISLLEKRKNMALESK